MVLLVLVEVQEAEVEEPVQGPVLELAQVVELVAGAGDPVGVVEQAEVAVQVGALVAELVEEAPS
ncbi:hypothetical protein HY640_03715 [Candidatus Woesearchaeota archaeon]|nr:hypothetical protein [Candidatus Woesearchaeota archaeon]